MKQVDDNTYFDISDMDGEIWKPTKEFDHVYMVSNMGRIKSLHKTWVAANGSTQRKLDTIMRGGINNCGYRRISVKKMGKRKNVSVHRIVAELFIPNTENKPFVNHKNGDKLDNRASNLEWVTGSENIVHAIKNGLFSPKGVNSEWYIKNNRKPYLKGRTGSLSPISRPVINIETNEVFDSIKCCAQKNNLIYPSLVYSLTLSKNNKTPFRFISKNRLNKDNHEA